MKIVGAFGKPVSVPKPGDDEQVRGAAGASPNPGAPGPRDVLVWSAKGAKHLKRKRARARGRAWTNYGAWTNRETGRAVDMDIFMSYGVGDGE